METDSEADSTRNRRVRSAYKGQVTKLLASASILERKDEIQQRDLDNLEHLLTELKAKPTLIEDLDSKIMDLTPEMEIEHLIVDADDYQSTIKQNLQILNKFHGRELKKFTEPVSTNPQMNPTAAAFTPRKKQHYRLPQLARSTFEGDILKWQSFLNA